MPPVGFEPTIATGELPQTYTLDRAATGTGWQIMLHKWKPMQLQPISLSQFHTWHIGTARSAANNPPSTVK